MFPHYWNDRSDTSRDRPSQQRGDIMHQNGVAQANRMKEKMNLGQKEGILKGTAAIISNIHDNIQYTSICDSNCMLSVFHILSLDR